MFAVSGRNRLGLAGIGLVAVLLIVPTAAAQVTLNANPGPSNNGGSPNWAMFFDLTSSSPITVTELTTANTGAAGAAFSVQVFVRDGTALGGPVGSGPGSSPAGWTSLGTVPATQGSTANGVSLPIDIPDIMLNPGQTVGVALQFATVGPRYFGTGTPPYETYMDGNLTLVTGDSRSVPFTTTGSWFASRALVGSITYTAVPEPSSAALLSLAAMGGWGWLRRRWQR